MLTITATNLPRFMACDGSMLMTGFERPVLDGDNTVREEGNAAHWLIQQIHSGAFTADELIDRKAPNGIFITADMVDHVEEFLKTAKHGTIEVETNNFGENWQINGRADSIIYEENRRVLTVSDFKYGWHIIEPEKNWTLISHAIAYLLQRPFLVVDKIIFTIFQPRPHHYDGCVRYWLITRNELFQLADEMVAKLSNPSNTLNTGPHCRNCPAIAFCPAARAAQMNIVEASENAFVDTLDNDALSFQIDQLKRAGEMLENLEKAYKELAIYRLRQGQIVNNYSLENQLTNRVWRENVTPEFVEMVTGRSDLVKKELITPNQVEKKGLSPDVVEALTTRHSKGVKLVRIDANKKANKIFNQPKGN
jgi:hypothetical protein